jgi:hypothetical protein
MNMKTNQTSLLLAALGGVLFYLLFWGESAGINMLLYSLFTFGGIYELRKEAYGNKAFIIAAAGHFVSALAILFIHSDLSVAAYIISLIVCLGFVHEASTHSIIFSFINAGWYVVTIPYHTFKSITELNFKYNEGLKKIIRIACFTVLPFFIVWIFFNLYREANVTFGKLTEEILIKIENFIDYLYELIHFDSILFLILGTLISAILFVTARFSLGSYFEKYFGDHLKEGSYIDAFPFNIIRSIRKELTDRFQDFITIKNEHRIAMITLVALNVLIFINNIIDIRYLWFGDFQWKDSSASELLHQGTGILIFSIILSMLVLIFFFRGDLNFIKNNRTLKILSYVWIIQNAILVLSVLDRDLFYIGHYGLTYKRIGVLFYLLSTLIGLFTLYIKISKQKTIYYLFRMNSMSAFMVLIMAACVNWDIIIYKYNISNKEKTPVDYAYLNSLSDQLIPYLEEIGYNSQPLAERKELFTLTQKYKGWLSWNYRDHRTLHAIENGKLKMGN